MATVPPVPPRPLESYERPTEQSAPPVPPLPPGFKPETEASPPHFEDPLVAPRPQKLQPDLPANMARTLDERVSSPYAQPSAHPPRNSSYYASAQPNLMPGFAVPQPASTPYRGPSPLPPAHGADWSPWNPASIPTPQQPYPAYPQQPYPPPQPYENLSSAFGSMSIGPQQSSPPPMPTYPPYSAQPPSPPHQVHGSPLQATAPLQPRHHARVPSSQQVHASPTPSNAPPSLTAPLPTIASLTAALSSIQQPIYDPARKVAWARDVVALVDRAHQIQTASANAPDVNSTDVPVGPVRIGDPQLQRLVDVAIPIIQQISSPQQPPSPLPPYVVEAIYLRAVCAASGAYPQYIPHSPRTAFRDFETAAKGGYHAAWFKLGRDYENFGDIGHAKDCFERGVKYGVESCLYRMGMAHLMGQLGLPSSPETALPLLHRAATLATVEVPQPAYVYGLLLLSEFSHIQLPPQLFQPFIPPGSTPQAEARKHLERAAYLNFAPAQYKLGHSYEYATPPFPFDALLSVQYYSLASQQGEVEADMALSKWFLCGAEGAFEKDEALAFTFAEKAAKKGLPSAEFAMGYYAEVGVGGPKDLGAARHWYTLAAEHGNADAAERMKALSQPAPQSLSRQEHENLADTTLVRKRTQAKQRSDARRSDGSAQQAVPADKRKIMDHVRKNSLAPPVAVGAAGGYGAVQPSLPPVNESPYSSPAPGNSTSPKMRPTQPSNGAPQGRPFQNAPRYSLVDPGSSPSATPRPTGTASPAPAPGGFDSGPAPAQAPAPRPTKGPQTFAEMGIASTRAEDKECLIM